MRIKAFSLIELIIVIILIGVIFSLALSSYMNKGKEEKLYTLEDLTSYMQKNNFSQNGTLFIYGNLCQHAVFRTSDAQDIQMPNFSFSNQNQVLKEDILERFVLIDFTTTKIEEKEERVCFSLNYKNGRFFDKYIISANNIYYFLSPYEQSIKDFNTLELAQNAYAKYDLYPKNIDEYHDK